MPELKPDSAETCALLEKLGRGDRQALDQLLVRHRPSLRSFVAARLGPDLQARLDASDIVQEAQMAFHVWVRKTAYERLLNAQRDHRHRARRSVLREAPWPERSSLLVARPILSSACSPSRQFQARELAERVARAITELSDTDREVLLMRHAEELPYDEIACLLEIEPAAARKRYGRALIRLQRILTKHGLLE
jgi:RNA polymerase sigma-70 factor (ECF subfamily)